MEIDFDKFKGTLPYASELYGIYQPLLGWKSRRMQKRVTQSIESFRGHFLQAITPYLRPSVEITGEDPREARFEIRRATEATRPSPLFTQAPSSHVFRRVLSEVERDADAGAEAWARYTRPEFLDELLAGIESDVREEYLDALSNPATIRSIRDSQAGQRRVLERILNRESVAAGLLGFLNGQAGPNQLMQMLSPFRVDMPLSEAMFTYEGLLSKLDPRRSALASALISPVGVVHLFRQYFFEFDTFLGPAVEHIWLSPGGMVEMVEISTRRTLIERITESTVEQLQRAEKSLFMEDELSDIVRLQNMSNSKFGVSLAGETSFKVGPIFTGEVKTATSYDLTKNTEEARQTLHRNTRRQTEWLATELKRSFKSTFKFLTEQTDTTSRRYVIKNDNPEMMNYEMRRKMRQVGVQIQDYGTHLCWQAYVDNPGDQLGLANLVHIAVPNDMPPRQQPELPADPQPYRGETLKLHFRWPLSDGSFSGGLDPEHFSDVIAGNFHVTPIPGFVLEMKVDVRTVSGHQWGFTGRPIGAPTPVAPGESEITLTEIQVYLPPSVQDTPGPRQPLTDEYPEWDFEVTPLYRPSDWLLRKVAEERAKKIADANQEQEREYKEKLFTAVKERVKLASKVTARPFEDLREEERIIVYRNLIQQLMSETGVESGPPQLRHVFAELVQSMFDVEKMLYFVAPEWWMPKVTTGGQNIFRPEANATEFSSYSTVTWGGARAQRDDNYYITEDSDPAKLGSSLGWIIQLDGDNLRNAFLNAPWVKAIIPIRENREEEAMQWLSSSDVEGAEGLDEPLAAPTAELDAIRTELGMAAGSTVTVRNGIEALLSRIRSRHQAANEKPIGADGIAMGYLRPDQVYETGFEPLQGGFVAVPSQPFEVFDQWVEVVPTHQIVPVEVEYDPKTGLQK